jgi:homoserine O-acetyltransferase/O-succinyltransferase
LPARDSGYAGLQIRHLRHVIGNSMGGMHTWLWGLTYPEFMDALVPMASQPNEMAGRNWMLRRLLIDAIRSDPDWKDGNYATQPRALRSANVFFGIATSGGAQGLYQLAPSRAQADRVVAERLAAPFTADANPAPGLERITATLLAINSADDERNPPELGIMEPALKRIKNARFYLIPADPETRGHGTTALAKFWKAQLADLLASAPARAAKGAE